MSAPRDCQVSDCTRPFRAQGYCGAHYEHARRAGQLETGFKRTKDYDMKRLLLERSTPADDGSSCRRWTGHRNRKGYGRVRYNGPFAMVHRVAHELWVGPIPDGYDVDHVAARGCRHRDRIEPSHLEAVTHAVNVARSTRGAKRHV